MKRNRRKQLRGRRSRPGSDVVTASNQFLESLEARQLLSSVLPGLDNDAPAAVFVNDAPITPHAPGAQILVTHDGNILADGDTTPTEAEGNHFGNVGVGQQAVQTLLITNTGTDTLSISSITIGGVHASDFTLLSSSTATIAAGQSANLLVRFSPAAATERYAGLIINSNAGNAAEFNFSLRGRGVVTPEIVVFNQANGYILNDGDTTPTRDEGNHFGAVELGQNRTRTFIIRNQGGSTLNLSGLTLVGPHASDFTVVSAPVASVAPGNSTQLTIRFTPAAQTERFAGLVFNNNDADEAQFNVSLRGIGSTAPGMTVAFDETTTPDNDTTPTPAEGNQFGTTILGVPVTRTFTITNTGGADLILSTPQVVGVHAADFTVTDQPSLTVLSGESTTMTLRFRPTVASQRFAGLVITNNTADENPYNFAIRGTGVDASDINVLYEGTQLPDNDTTPTLNEGNEFGAFPVGASSTHTFTIENLGSRALTISSVQIVGIHAADYTLTTAPASTIAVGATTTMDVTFAPSVGTDRYAGLIINTNDPDEAQYNFSMRGVGITRPEIEMLFDGEVIFDGDSTPSEAEGNEFGSVGVGGTVDRTFTITNSGNIALNISGINIVGVHAADFTVVDAPDSTVAVNDSTTITLRFTPSAATERFAGIRIFNNDADENPYNFSLHGRGVGAPDLTVFAAATPVADNDTTPDPTDFTDYGSTQTGTNVDRSYTLINTGSQTLTISSVQIVGVHAADFTIISAPVTSVNAGEGETVTVRFTPSAATERFAGLVINSNDPDTAVYNFAIKGRGTVGPSSSDLAQFAYYNSQSTSTTPTVASSSAADDTDELSSVQPVSNELFGWLDRQLITA